MKLNETGLFYTNGDAILDGDTIKITHQGEEGKLKFIRGVKWSDKHAAFITFDDKYGYEEYLGEEFQNPNLIKIERL